MNLDTHRSTRSLDFSLTSVNVVFLLLLFFLSAGTLMQDAETAIDAPRTADLPLEHLPRPLMVVTADGDMYLDGEPVTLMELAARARSRGSPANPEAVALPVLHVLPDRGMDAARFLEVVRSVREIGLWNITLVTIRE